MIISVIGPRSFNKTGGIEVFTEKLFSRIKKDHESVDISIYLLTKDSEKTGVINGIKYIYIDVPNWIPHFLEKFYYSFKAVIKFNENKLGLVHLHGLSNVLVIPLLNILGFFSI